MSRTAPAAALLACCLNALPVGAEPITLDGALKRLREGPTGQSIRLRVEEARGQLTGARRLADNPSVQGSLGQRLGEPDPDRRVEGSVELMQPLEIGGRRRARIMSAQASVETEQASGEAALRHAEAELAVAFFRTLAGRQREQIAGAAETAARRAVEALERRYQLKDVALLDVNVGKGTLARATALLRAARADSLTGETALRRLLAIESSETLELTGNLRDQRRFDERSLVERAQNRGEVRALMAQAREAEALAAGGRAARWPRLAVGASYERDEGTDVVLGILGIDLPFFDRGQGDRAVGKARAQRLSAEAETARRIAATGVRGAEVVYQERLSAARTLEQALPLFEQNEDLARRSYEAGQLSLADWLVVRREALDSRLEYLDRLLAAAEAGVALAEAAGVSP